MNKVFFMLTASVALALTGCEETGGELGTAEEPALGEGAEQVEMGGEQRAAATEEPAQQQGAQAQQQGAQAQQQGAQAQQQGAQAQQQGAQARQQGQQQPPQDLSEGEIAAALQAINQAEIEQAQIARERGESREVQQFAQRMIRDHTRSQQQLTSILQQTDVQPQQGQVTQRLQQESQQLMSRLRQQQGAELDRAYIDAQVREHRDAVALLDANMGNAQNEQLAQFLRDQRRTIDEHRQMAERVETTVQPRASR